jgi:hypothetical protein
VTAHFCYKSVATQILEDTGLAPKICPPPWIETGPYLKVLAGKYDIILHNIDILDIDMLYIIRFKIYRV